MTDEQTSDAGAPSAPNEGPLYHGTQTDQGWQLKPGQDARPQDATDEASDEPTDEDTP